jgi:hypothetical protein
MPLRDFTCQSCSKVQERFFWNTAGVPNCACGGELDLLPLSVGIPGKSDIFPYTTTHLDGKGTPITVESLGHARALEKKYGVVIHGFSNNKATEFHDLPKQRVGGRGYYD